MAILRQVFLLLFFMGASMVHSAPVPAPSSSAGVVEREIEKDYKAKEIEPEKEVPILEIEIPSERLELPDGKAIHVERITFCGNTVFSQETLEKLAICHLDSEMTMEDIRELCLEVQKIYVKKGYFLARAFPPEQEIEGGELVIQVIEGVLGNIQVVGNKKYSEKFIRSYFTALQGQTLCYGEFLKAVMLLNENSDLKAGAVFDRGEEPGTADCIIRVVDKQPFHVYLDINNYGSEDTTRWRTGARINYGNLGVYGDMLTLVEVVGLPVQHLDFTSLSYALPVNAKGATFSLSYLFSRFKVNEFHPLNLKGQSNIAGIQFNQALVRTRALNDDFYLGFDYKNVKNISLGKALSDDRLRVPYAGITVDYIDSLKGRNLLDFYTQLGIPDFLGGSDAVDPQSSRPGGGGRFTMFNLDYQRIQQCVKDVYLFLNFSGQYSLNKLTLPQQFYIGGMDTVRGFPLAVALGDQGYYANVEVRFPLPGLANQIVPFSKKRKWKELVQLLGFVDNGQVWFIGGKAPQENGHEALTSLGLGLRIFNLFRFDANLDVAFPIEGGSHPFVYFRLNFIPL
jgi:hemolysin activation/secretion protein